MSSWSSVYAVVLSIAFQLYSFGIARISGTARTIHFSSFPFSSLCTSY
uniref:Uncharacterized protein n=1 Tax=Rhizophora mucronata TaxID=61149 RepID=A0A2P2QTA9_RHIMU